VDIHQIDIANLPYICPGGLRLAMKSAIPSRMLVASREYESTIPVEHPKTGDLYIGTMQYPEHIVDAIAIGGEGIGYIDCFTYR
jgi:hypothetical protein